MLLIYGTFYFIIFIVGAIIKNQKKDFYKAFETTSSILDILVIITMIYAKTKY
jgi:hypothetical protein